MRTVLLRRISLHSWLWWWPWQGSIGRTRWHAVLWRGYVISLWHWRPLRCHWRPLRCHWRALRCHWRPLHSSKGRPWLCTNLWWKPSSVWRWTWVIRWGLGNWWLGWHDPWELRWSWGGWWPSRERGGLGGGKQRSLERGLCWRKWASIWLGGTRRRGCGKRRLRDRRNLREGLLRNRWWGLGLSGASGGERRGSIWERLLGRRWSSVVGLGGSLSHSFSRQRLCGSSGGEWKSGRSSRCVGSGDRSLGYGGRG